MNRLGLSSNNRVSIAVRIERDRCTISVNTSGTPLHKRGYRLQVGKAPLREHLAAGALIFLGLQALLPEQHDDDRKPEVGGRDKQSLLEERNTV